MAEPPDLTALSFDRRTLLGVFGALIAAATLKGCSADTSSSPTSTTRNTLASTATTTGPARVLAFDYAAPIDSARLQHLADTYNGSWVGNWGETTGDTGTLQATVTIDPALRRFAMKFSYTGAFLQGGAGTPDLVDVTIPNGPTPENQPVPLGLTGAMNLTYQGGTTASISAASLPGSSDGLSADLALLGDSATASYTIKAPGGHLILGAAIVGRNHTPEPVNLSSIAEQHLNASINSGQYAADLLSAQDASAAVGATIDAMVANGGNLLYAAGVVTTNTRAVSAHGVLVIQITIYRCADAAAMSAYWLVLTKGLEPHVAGLGDDAIVNPLGLYMLVGHVAATIQVLALGDTPLPVAVHTAQKNLALAIAPKMRAAP